VNVKRTNLSPSRQWFNTLIATVAGGCSLTLCWFGMHPSTRYTTPDATIEIGSTSATVE